MKLNRRDFLRISGTFSLSLTAGCAFAADNKGNLKGSRPNLLIIHTDEHNFRTLGCYRKTLPAKQAFVWGENVIVETPTMTDASFSFTAPSNGISLAQISINDLVESNFLYIPFISQN